MDWSKITAFNMAGKEVVKVYDNVHEKTLWEKQNVSFLTLTADNDDNTISLASVADSEVEYKVDNGEWTAYDTATTLSGGSIKVRAVNKTTTPVTFKGTTVTGKFKVSGSLDSILDWKKLQQNKASQITHATSCFQSMFQQNSNLTDASGLSLPNIETLPKNCYYQMFYQCSNLKKAFTTITAKVFGDYACYNMFYAAGLIGSFAIENIETIGAYSCYGMFDNTLLDSISENTFAKLGENSNDMSFACRYMLRATNVSSVMKTLPIKKIGKGMYMNMFTSCQKLTTAPEIKATGFNNDTFVVSSGTEGAFYGMFDNCQYLTSVQTNMYMEEAAGADFANMFQGCVRLAKGTNFTALKKFRTNASMVFYQTYCKCSQLSSDYALPSALTYGNNSTSTLKDLFRNMFYECTSLVTPPELPTMSYNTGCTYAHAERTFGNMFAGCTKLASLPILNGKLPELYAYDFEGMFSRCTSLTEVPSGYLSQYNSALSLGTFQFMFSDCTNITTLGNGDTVLGAWNCDGRDATFNSMFTGCTGITEVSDSFATFTGQCGVTTFSAMFSGCEFLYYVPQNLLANITSFGSSCCIRMFEKCYRLAEPVFIKATTYDSSAFDSMFENTAIYISETEDAEYATPYVIPNQSTAINRMFYGTRGTFTGTPEAGKTYYLRQQALCMTSESATEFTFSGTNLASGVALQTSTDNMTWEDYTVGNDVSSSGGKLYVRGKNNTVITGNDSTAQKQFVIKTTVNDISLSGVSTCLLKYNVIPSDVVYGMYPFGFLFTDQTALKNVAGWRINEGFVSDTSITSGVYNYTFRHCTNLETVMKTYSQTGYRNYFCMFQGCTSLVNFGVDKEEQAEYTLDTLMYRQMYLMFHNCTSLKKAMKMTITGTAEGCMAGMYHTCSSLEDASNITINAYIADIACLNMFWSCANLETAPTMVINGTGYQGCITMFNGCSTCEDFSSIKIMGEIGANGCKQMFAACYAMLTPPVFGEMTCVRSTYGSSTYSGYQFQLMFDTCLNMEETPDLSGISSTDPYCFSQMFQSCSSLKDITWKFASMNMALACCYKMFYYCNSLQTVPADMLPSTTLTQSCYQQMFDACVYLIVAPNLPATVVPTYGYQQMFSQCFNLTDLPTISATTINQQGMTQMFYDTGVQLSATQQGEFTNAWKVSATSVGTNAFQNMFSASQGTFTGDLTANTTYYYKRTQFIAFKSATGSTITFTHNGSIAKLQTSTDNITYTDYTAGTTISGTNIYVRGTGNTNVASTATAASGDTSYPFVLAGATDIDVRGNLNALLDYSDSTLTELSVGSSCFRKLFYGQSGIKTIFRLCIPNRLTSDFCYDNMFANCTGIGSNGNIALLAETAKKYCYRSMYYGCTSMTTNFRAVIHAKNLYEYSCAYFYNKCTALAVQNWTFSHVRNVLGSFVWYYFAAQTGTKSLLFYYMYPLKHVTFSSGVAYVFANLFSSCTNLTSVSTGLWSKLPSLLNGEFANAFNGCTALTTLPTLPSITGVTTIPNYCFDNTFRGCAAITTVPDDYFAGYTVIGSYGLRSFFYESGITSVPRLDHFTYIGQGGLSFFVTLCASIRVPVTVGTSSCTLATQALQQMYNNCSLIKVSATQTGDYTNAFTVVTSTNVGTDALLNMFNGTSGTFTSTPTAGTTYYYAA